MSSPSDPPPVRQGDIEEIRERLDAIELALTYGLKCEDVRDKVTCAIQWAKKYTAASLVWSAPMERAEVLDGSIGRWFRSHVKASESFGFTLDTPPAEFYLAGAFGSMDPATTVRIVRAMDRLSWADFGAKVP